MLSVRKFRRAESIDPATAMERRILRRRIRRWIIAVALMVVFVEYAGLPHLRISYSYTGSYSAPHIHTARYWSITGWQDAYAGQYGRGCPLIVMIPLKKSPLTYGREAVTAVWKFISERIGV